MFETEHVILNTISSVTICGRKELLALRCRESTDPGRSIDNMITHGQSGWRQTIKGKRDEKIQSTMPSQDENERSSMRGAD